MPQNEHIEVYQRRYGRRFDLEERKRKRIARLPKLKAKKAKKLIGLPAKLYSEKMRKEKITIKKTIAMHEQGQKKERKQEGIPQNAVPAYLLERDQADRSKILSNSVKQKRKEKAGKWDVPLPKVDTLIWPPLLYSYMQVRPVSEQEMFKVLKSGKRRKKSWKRMITKVTFVGPTFTRKPPKYERFIRPSGLRMTKAHVTHPELKTSFCLDIIGIKKNPNGSMYTSLGVVTKGTIIEVNVSDLGLVTPGGKVVWGKYAQVTNNPENDGCVNAVLLV